MSCEGPGRKGSKRDANKLTFLLCMYNYIKHSVAKKAIKSECGGRWTFGKSECGELFRKSEKLKYY